MADDDSLSLFDRDPRAQAPLRRAATPPAHAPLAERMRPRDLDEVVGQDALVGAGGPLRALAEAGEPALADPLGPARLREDDARAAARRASPRAPRFVALSAVTAGVQGVREVVDRARAASAGRAPHGALPRRDPPLQPRPAGRAAAARRGAAP